MFKGKAHEVIASLDAGSKKNLSNYCLNLLSPKDKPNYDEDVQRVLDDYVVDKPEYSKVKSYLKSIGFTQGRYSYDGIERALTLFTRPNHANFAWNRNYRLAKAEIIDEVKEANLRLLDYSSNSDIEDALPRKDTHAGFEYILSGLKAKGDNLECIFERYETVEREARKEGSFNRIILVASRTQGSGQFDKDKNYEFTFTFKCKTRFVSMIDLFQIIAELKFTKQFQKWMGFQEWYAGGDDDSRINNRLSKWRHEYGYTTTFDFSSFDQTISDWLIREAFDVIRSSFNGCGFDEELFTIVREDLIHKCFINGKGEVVESNTGLPSGSMFTQIVGSIVNKLMITTYLKSKNINKGYKMCVMGDDNILFTNEIIDVDDAASYLAHNFGVIVNSDKMDYATTNESPEFLSRVWTYEGVWRHPRILISKMLYSENFRNYMHPDKSKRPNPYMIVEAYIQSFPIGMKELIDIERFHLDNLVKIRKLSKADLAWMNGIIAYQARYA